MTRALIVAIALLCGLQARAQEQTLGGTLELQGSTLWVAWSEDQRVPLDLLPSQRTDLEAIVGWEVKLRVRARQVDVPGRSDARYQAYSVVEVLEPRLLSAPMQLRRRDHVSVVVPEGPRAKPLTVVGPAALTMMMFPEFVRSLVVRGWQLGDKLLLLGVRGVTTRETVVRVGPPWASYPASAIVAGRSVWIDRPHANGLVHTAGGALVRLADLDFYSKVEPDRPAGTGLVGALGE